MVISGRPVLLTTLFLYRLRPPKRLTSTSCIYFRQLLRETGYMYGGKNTNSRHPVLTISVAGASLP